MNCEKDKWFFFFFFNTHTREYSKVLLYNNNNNNTSTAEGLHIFVDILFKMTLGVRIPRARVRISRSFPPRVCGELGFFFFFFHFTFLVAAIRKFHFTHDENNNNNAAYEYNIWIRVCVRIRMYASLTNKMHVQYEHCQHVQFNRPHSEQRLRIGEPA